MASACAASAVAAVAISSSSSQKSASFLGGRKLRQKKFTTQAGPRSLSVSAAVADADRPLWFPGSTPPPWLDGRLSLPNEERK